jgi:diaminohydroxyphosphoribosylaminopyrimidine deaminase/5-amino-6-(5-phosphoribosylamino)uracil reductase
LIREDLVDELLVYMAPMLLGPQARPLLALPEITRLDASPRFTLLETAQFGNDLRLRLRRAAASDG